jgi:hypothetical protein
MGPKKRKAESTGLDEMDRELYQRFRAAANSVSSLYTSSLNLQKRAFNGGARHTTEKLLQWALSQQASGEKAISASDLIQALQAELVVLEGEDACLAAAGDSLGGVAPWTPSDRAAGATGRTRALAALDANTVSPHKSRARRVSPARGLVGFDLRIRLAASNPLVFEKSLVPTLTRLARERANRNTNRVWARSSGRRSRSTRRPPARTPGAPARRARTSRRPGRA